MLEYTVKEYEKEDYDQQRCDVDAMPREELADSIRGIARGWLPDYNFTGKEDDFDAHKLQMIMCRVAEILESESAESNLLEEALEIQKGYQALIKNKQFTKKAVCNLVIPFRDRHRLTDLQALRIARNELSVYEIISLLKRGKVDYDKSNY